MSAVMLVVGEGLLADHMCEELSSQYMVVRQTDFGAIVPGRIDLALVLQDAWNPSVHQKAEEMFSSNQHSLAPWLFYFWRGGSWSFCSTRYGRMLSMR